MGILFENEAWDDLTDMLGDKRYVKKFASLLKDIQRNGNTGIGKPEPLKGNLSGYWSRRIDEYNRLVYTIKDDDTIIISCKGHYE
ncbi:addiction module toxin, Txe/YoeB family protein [Actinomycetota bacterium]|nr:addiction module toxin, Txe/YoeB family protein [Actinomycetota bacterium]